MNHKDVRALIQGASRYLPAGSGQTQDEHRQNSLRTFGAFCPHTMTKKRVRP